MDLSLKPHCEYLESIFSIFMWVPLSRGTEVRSGVLTSVAWIGLTVRFQPPWSLSALARLLYHHHVENEPLSPEGFALALLLCSDHCLLGLGYCSLPGCKLVPWQWQN